MLDTTRPWLPYALKFVNVEDLPHTQQLQDFDVQATALSHRVPSFAYSFSEKTVENRLDATRLEGEGITPGPEWGQLRQGNDVQGADGRVLRALDYLLPTRKPRKIIIGGDNDTPDLLLEEASSADVLVHEATYTEDVLHKVGPGPQHSSAKRVARLASAARIKNLVLTHFSPRYQEQQGSPSLTDIEAEARAVYDGRLYLANDLDRYLLDRQGVLTRAA
ncbi:MAG TPA: hypothetical protein VIG66_05460 [Noviherbaspirillum sp.]